jgi:hypothetical protein
MPASPLVIIELADTFTRRHVVLSTALLENKLLFVFCDGKPRLTN